MPPTPANIATQTFGTIKNVPLYADVYGAIRKLLGQGQFILRKKAPIYKAIRGVKSGEPHSSVAAQTTIYDPSLIRGTEPSNRFTGRRVPGLTEAQGGKASKKDAGHYMALTLNAHVTEGIKYAAMPKNDFMITNLDPGDYLEIGNTLYVFHIGKDLLVYDLMSRENILALESISQSGVLAQAVAGKTVLDNILDPHDHTWSRALHDALVDTPQSGIIDAMIWESAQAKASGLPDCTNLVILGEPNDKLPFLHPEKIIRVTQGPYFRPEIEYRPINNTFSEAHP
ncbi:hypothetical protein F183_A11370 [Bryobacterales bacterium F-183]|nr:hypothetical protein F183_A11370 [Bryobacterales bacterium F-183]